MQLHIRGNNSHVLDVEQNETVAEIKVISMKIRNQVFLVILSAILRLCVYLMHQ